MACQVGARLPPRARLSFTNFEKYQKESLLKQLIFINSSTNFRKYQNKDPLSKPANHAISGRVLDEKRWESVQTS